MKVKSTIKNKSWVVTVSCYRTTREKDKSLMNICVIAQNMKQAIQRAESCFHPEIINPRLGRCHYKYKKNDQQTVYCFMVY